MSVEKTIRLNDKELSLLVNGQTVLRKTGTNMMREPIFIKIVPPKESK